MIDYINILILKIYIKSVRRNIETIYLKNVIYFYLSDFSDLQKSVINGIIAGDGHLRSFQSNYLLYSQSIDHSYMFFYVVNILCNLTNSTWLKKIKYLDKGNILFLV
jgi:hypothetical protein